jgi:hypothetical protein
MTSERDWRVELVTAGVIAPTGFNDLNGNPAYRLLRFPGGEEGLRLKALFDRHVQGHDGQRRAGSPRIGRASARAGEE